MKLNINAHRWANDVLKKLNGVVYPDRCYHYLYDGYRIAKRWFPNDQKKRQEHLADLIYRLVHVPGIDFLEAYTDYAKPIPVKWKDLLENV